MTALSGNLQGRTQESQSDWVTRPVANGVVIFRGALLMHENASKYAEPAAQGIAGYTVIGISRSDEINNSNGSNGDENVTFSRDPGPWLIHVATGSALANVADYGETVYVIDDDTIGLAEDSILQGADLLNDLQELGITPISTATYTILDIDHVIVADTTATSIALTLPDAADLDGQRLAIIKAHAPNTLTITTSLSQTIDNLTLPLSYTAVDSIIYLRSDGANWEQIYAVDPIPVGLFLGLESSNLARVQLVVP